MPTKVYYVKAFSRRGSTISTPGHCPYLGCFVHEPHSHLKCDTCGADRFGNAFCADCIAWRTRSAIRLAQLPITQRDGMS